MYRSALYFHCFLGILISEVHCFLSFVFFVLRNFSSSTCRRNVFLAAGATVTVVHTSYAMV